MKPQSPCLGCKERAVGCHADCPRYAEYRNELDDWKQNVLEQIKAEKLADSYEARKIRRLKGEKTWQMKKD